MSYDAIVIGGSFAGISAAMQLARACRRVLLVDAGLPRNRFAAHAHGLIGHDGKTPAAIRAEALAQLAAYSGATFLQGEARHAEADGERFLLSFADGSTARAARLVLATGVRDELPAVAGLAERWGASVLHCPYCHGYEMRGKQLGVLANHESAVHQALLLPDWGPTILFTQGRYEPDAESAAALAARGVAIERSPIVALLGQAPSIEAVRLADGRSVPLGAIFTAPRTHMASPLAGQLGCELSEGPTGPFIRVDATQETTVRGVFAAGDAAAPMPNATFAAAAGVMAGVAAHRSLVMPRAD